MDQNGCEQDSSEGKADEGNEEREEDAEKEEGQKSGNSLIDAIMDKYGDMESGLHDFGDVQVRFRAPAKKTQSEEDCGNKTTLKLPGILVLNRCQISKAGDRDKIAALCGPVQELDLAENSLQCWSEIGAITSEIPNLEFLNLSSNPLYKAPSPEDAVVTMTTIRRLVLNNTNTPWETVHSILKATPSLNELHLSLNKFSTVSPSPEAHSSVKLLQFNNNEITDWSEVQKLGRMFPNLETLILMENQIRTLDACAPSDFFPQLKMICLSDTLLDSWEELDKLDSFPLLTEVLVMGVPLLQVSHQSNETGSRNVSGGKPLEEKKKKIRQLVIARLGKLTRLNRSRITESERENAERMCIRMFKHSEDKPPRYDELVQKHGHLQDLAKVDLKPQTVFRCEVLLEDLVVDKGVDIDVTQTVQQLKKQVAQMVKLPVSKFRLFLIEWDVNGDLIHTTELTAPSRFLHTFWISDGVQFKAVPKS